MRYNGQWSTIEEGNLTRTCPLQQWSTIEDGNLTRTCPLQLVKCVWFYKGRVNKKSGGKKIICIIFFQFFCCKLFYIFSFLFCNSVNYLQNLIYRIPIIVTNELFEFGSARSKIRDSGIIWEWFRIIWIRDLKRAKTKLFWEKFGKSSRIIHQIREKFIKFANYLGLIRSTE